MPKFYAAVLRMHRTAAYGCVFVSVCLSVYYCYNCSTAEMKVQLRGFIGLSPFFLGFTFVDLENKASFSRYSQFCSPRTSLPSVMPYYLAQLEKPEVPFGSTL